MADTATTNATPWAGAVSDDKSNSLGTKGWGDTAVKNLARTFGAEEGASLEDCARKLDDQKIPFDDQQSMLSRFTESGQARTQFSGWPVPKGATAEAVGMPRSS